MPARLLKVTLVSPVPGKAYPGNQLIPGRSVLNKSSALSASILELWAAQEQNYALLCLDLDGIVLSASAAVARVLGYETYECIGLPIDAFFLPSDRELGLVEHEREVALAVGFSEDDRWHLRKDGTQIWIGGLMTTLKNTEGEAIGFMKIMRDRTDLRGQIEALQNRVEALQRDRSRKQDYLKTIAHELANPLTPLRNAMYVLPLSPPEKRAEFHATAMRQLEIVSRLIGDLRDAAENSSGPQLKVVDVHLQEVLERVSQSCRPSAAEHGLSLQLIVPEGPIYLEADSDRLHQVFLNLVHNAIKYSRPRGSVWLKATVESESAVIRVEDDGVGIEPDMLPRIFDLFTQEDASRHLSEGGVGVGLAVVRELVSLHGGNVEVRSEGRGKGSNFAVRLPLRQPR
jgi:PAS domain S-box-containing protein